MTHIWTFSGDRIKLARELKQMTVADCAAGIGAAGHQWKAWEEGKVEPGTRTLAKICTMLNGPPNFFFEWTGGDK